MRTNFHLVRTTGRQMPDPFNLAEMHACLFILMSPRTSRIAGRAVYHMTGTLQFKFVPADGTEFHLKCFFGTPLYSTGA